MRHDSFRFSPPEWDPAPELAWALARAFAIEEPVAVQRLDAAHALAWSRSFSLSARVASRTPRRLLTEELGAAAAEELVADHKQCLAQALLNDETTRFLAAGAERSRRVVILLKGAALMRLGLSAPGSRPSVDVDILLAPEDAAALSRALEEFGFAAERRREVAHHLPSWIHPMLPRIETHTFLPGVSAVSGERMTAARMRAAGLVRGVGRREIHTPAPSVLAAHCIAHAVDQHAYSPLAYPMLRAVGDLLDLTSVDGLEALIAEAAGFLWRSVSRREIAAVFRLVACLEQGEIPARGEDAGKLLGHVICGSRDTDYRRRLRRRAGLRALLGFKWRKMLAWTAEA